MSQRRSTRAASAKPTPKSPPKPPARAPRSQPAKRQVSPERSPPPPKRKRTESTEPEQAVGKPVRSKPTSAKKPSSRSQRTTAAKPHINGLAPVHEEVQQQPFFNPIPPIPVHTRPAPQLFVWGAGNFGQFGMGPEFLGEFGKPKKSVWIEEQIANGTFGGQGAGLEAVAAGGLHTLFIDEQGTVSCTHSSIALNIGK